MFLPLGGIYGDIRPVMLDCLKGLFILVCEISMKLDNPRSREQVRPAILVVPKVPMLFDDREMSRTEINRSYDHQLREYDKIKEERCCARHDRRIYGVLIHRLRIKDLPSAGPHSDYPFILPNQGETFLFMLGAN